MTSPIEENPLFEKEHRLIKRTLTRQQKRLERQLEKAQEDLKNSSQWEKLQHEAELLQSNYPKLKRGMPDIDVWDWVSEKQLKIVLSPKLTPQEQVADRFKQSKKLRKSIPYVEARLQRLEKDLTEVSLWLSELEGICESTVLESWRQRIPLVTSNVPQKKESLVKEKRQSFLEYVSGSGMKIWVGKKASDNETLTFSLAKGLDWWLHAAGVPGSHVVIRTGGKTPDPETLQDAIQLALYYSKAKQAGEGEVSVTQCKYVSRFGKGMVGKVQISKHKNYYARIDPDRLNEIRKRNY